ncbi:MAG: PAS domain-containing protein [Parvibaculum sp.]|nr:PAS domain-containing protein [Parvibaculum sp.]
MSYREVDISDVPNYHPVSLFSNFWFDKKGDALVPLRSAIEPTKIPAILPWLLLLEVVMIDGKQQFRYRLSGTGCRDIFGIDYTGKLLGEGLMPDGAEARKLEFQKVVETGKVIYSSSHLPIAERSFINVYRGVFPVSLNGNHIDQIFVVIAKEDLALETSRQVARTHQQQSRLSMF